MAIAMRKDPEMTMPKIAVALQVSGSALYRQLAPILQQEHSKRAEPLQQLGRHG